MAKRIPQAAALVTFLALALAGTASGNDETAPTEQPEPTIVMHIANYAGLSPQILDVAKARVAAVYKLIGVRAIWDESWETRSRFENGQLHVNVLLLPRDKRPKKNSAGEDRPDLLGAAHLPSGRAYIFYDRIAAMPAPSTAFALGDVIAHEVGHLVLQVNRHSPSGIMRASLAGATIYPQSFNGDESRTIRTSLMAAK